ncbi:ubiquitin-like-conjugating enzyme ATG10 isoform X1 [Zingiber officinale]|uniref:ubiquitin-like-conjugating enzyme ATG10 isoform X1 n=1 Tax=Zingiber officinale TaxID=94328 RepID=UPI001C4C95D0|nr:ubiquitin-like-conjugating enzyme ATG10 isoform X1 [Zingiber officinale]
MSMYQWDGTLSPSEFDISVSDLCERWREVGTSLPQWVWLPDRALGALSCDVAAGYLAIENIYHQNASEEGSCEESISRDEEPFDEATLVPSNKNDMHIYDYHILYSFTFRVPVLYFRGYQSDGCPLKLVDIEKDLPAYSLKLLRESKWAFITQEDHPYLHRPWYTLHPCGTGDWMKFLLCSDAPNKIPPLHGYLSAWLSVIGQVVGLRIPIGFFKSV